MKKVTFILLLCFILSGCVTVGKKVNQANINHIEKGRTTKAEVVELFGQPNNVSFNQDNHLIFTYIGSRANNTVWNFIPVVSTIHSKIDVKSQKLTITFLDDIVQTYNFTSTDTPVKFGLIP